MKWFKLALRILLSAFFVASAVSKLMSMDAFEIYVYRTSFLGYDAATIASRLVVSAELAIAILLLFRLKFRFAWWCSLIFLLGMSAFLLLQLANDSDENCFCLGELAELSPTESLVKNGVLLIMLLLIRKSESLKFKASNWIFGAVILTSVVIPPLLSPPDVLISGRFNPAEHDQLALNQALEEGKIPYDFFEGRKLLAFYSTGCKFCRMASTRIGVLVEKSNLETEQVNIVFWGDSTVEAHRFFEDTHSPDFRYTSMETRTYLDITKGRMPLLLLINNGLVEHRMNYRTFEEDLIEEFLKGEN